jgi:guanylate kinase
VTTGSLGASEEGDAYIADLRARRKPRLFVISGPSGVGKDALIQRLRESSPDLHYSVTATTRERRPGEIDGVHYYFLDRETFRAWQQQGNFLESAVVYDNLYGVPKNPIRHALARGQDVVVKVDVQGAEHIRELGIDAVFIFVAPESLAALLQRLRTRKSEDPDLLISRFGAASRELLEAGEFDYVVFNESGDLERAAAEIEEIMRVERLRTNQADVSL